MPYNFANSVKGGIAEELVSALLLSAGYKVIPIGVEHSVAELKNLAHSEDDLERQTYHRVHPALTKLPDFLVFDPDDAAWGPFFLETKYRGTVVDIQNWPDLHQNLLVQARAWKDVYVIFFLGEPYQAGPNPQPDAATNRCRVFRIVAHEDALRFVAMADRPGWAAQGDLVEPQHVQWLHGEALQRFFPRLQNLAEDRTILKAAEIIAAVHRALAP